MELTKGEVEALKTFFECQDAKIILSKNQWDEKFGKTKYKNQWKGIGLYLYFFDEDGDYCQYWRDDWEKTNFADIEDMEQHISQIILALLKIRRLESIKNIIDGNGNIINKKLLVVSDRFDTVDIIKQEEIKDKTHGRRYLDFYCDEKITLTRDEKIALQATLVKD